jgi:choline dehydrogenase
VLLLEEGAAAPPAKAGDPQAWMSLWESPATTGGSRRASRSPTPPIRRGRVPGGSSAINTMIFVRGHRSSYDRWAEPGATGRGFADLLPYFMRTETAADRDPAVRGTSGPLTVAPANPAGAENSVTPCGLVVKP